ncbi:MAG: M20/M25/M40 family metallo-hydrolase [Chloroflexi bacterium]|nr:M20/M25/M40 family metallo-hydrolase [Chloroflexota bacterium]
MPNADLQRLFDELKWLTDLPGTAGFEQPVVRALRERLTGVVDEIDVDAIGNLYALVRGSEGGCKIICPAHSDAVGFMIRYVEPNGFLRVANLGRIPPYLLYGQRVRIYGGEHGTVYGVVGTKPGHIMFSSAGAEQREYPGDRLTVPPYDDLFVDIGARSAAEVAEAGLRPGLEVTYDRDLQWLGDGRRGLVTSRALDDRVGCLALLETIRRLREAGQKPRADVYFTFCTQEEMGLRGAQVAGGYVQPDICIGVDGTISASGDGCGEGVVRAPYTSGAEAPSFLGAGVGISFNDQSAPGRGLIGNAKLNAALMRLAKEHDVPHQLEGFAVYITSDAAAIQYGKRGGVPAATLKVPMSYTHGPVESCSLHDIDATARLLTLALLELGKDTDLTFV